MLAFCYLLHRNYLYFSVSVQFGLSGVAVSLSLATRYMFRSCASSRNYGDETINSRVSWTSKAFALLRSQESNLDPIILTRFCFVSPTICWIPWMMPQYDCAQINPSMNSGVPCINLYRNLFYKLNEFRDNVSHSGRVPNRNDGLKNVLLRSLSQVKYVKPLKL